MNYEQKYKEALERAKRLHSEPTGGTERIVCEQIFPELQESEDEWIKDDIKDVIQAAIIPEESKREMLDWLEKQGEQKQTWEPDAAQLIVIKDLIEEENTSKVNKVILRGMLDEFKQFTNSQSSQFSDVNLSLWTREASTIDEVCDKCVESVQQLIKAM